MAGVNKVIIVGRLGANPEVRKVSSGQSVAHFNVATSENWVDQQGQKQERTEWHRIVVWGKLADICGQHLSKGRQVYIEGRITTRQWEDKQGQKRYTTEIVGNTVQFLGSAGERTSNNYAANESESSGADFNPEPSFDGAAEDLPF